MGAPVDGAVKALAEGDGEGSEAGLAGVDGVAFGAFGHVAGNAGLAVGAEGEVGGAGGANCGGLAEDTVCEVAVDAVGVVGVGEETRVADRAGGGRAAGLAEGDRQEALRGHSHYQQEQREHGD